MQLEKLTKSDWVEILGEWDIVAAGGGCKFALGIGMAEILEEHCFKKGIWPLYVRAVSAGALGFASIIANSGVAPLREIWECLQHAGKDALCNRFAMWLHILTRRNSLFSNSGIQKLLATIDAEKLVRSPVVLQIAVHHESMRHGAVYKLVATHDSRFQSFPADYLKFLEASSALCGVFKPVWIDGHPYSDGLMPPIEEAVAACRKTIFLLVNNQGLPLNPEKASWSERVNYSFDFTYDDELYRTMKHAVAAGYAIVGNASPLPMARRIRKLAPLAEDCDPAGKVIVLCAAKRAIRGLRTAGFNSKFFGFWNDSLLQAMAHGRECMREALEELVKFRSRLSPNEPPPA